MRGFHHGPWAAAIHPRSFAGVGLHEAFQWLSDHPTFTARPVFSGINRFHSQTLKVLAQNQVRYIAAAIEKYRPHILRHQALGKEVHGRYTYSSGNQQAQLDTVAHFCRYMKWPALRSQDINGFTGFQPGQLVSAGPYILYQ